MSRIRITKEFSFEMAHALEGYDGACSQIHGHSYKLFVTVKGSPLANPDNPKSGMVMDFNDLKKIVVSTIINKYDHSMIVRSSERNKQVIDFFHSQFDRIITTDYQPTCENMISRFAEMIKAELPEGIVLHSLRMHETATSFAEWFQEDNPY